MDIFGYDIANLALFTAIGFLAQLVDGALGMAFGAIANILLVGMLGMPPAQASYRVHIIKCFTTAASGISHYLNGNVDKRLFFLLLVPGVAGGALGAIGLTHIDGEAAKPLILAYLTLLGAYLLLRGMRGGIALRKPRFVRPFGFAGGLLDAIGGGGWGPVVSSSLMVQGIEPRLVVGTVNAVEVFVAIAISATFLLHLGPEFFATATLGLMLGGILAAPLGALIAKTLPSNILLMLVGSVLVATGTIGMAATVA